VSLPGRAAQLYNALNTGYSDWSNAASHMAI
jgi:hypothetical protein